MSRPAIPRAILDSPTPVVRVVKDPGDWPALVGLLFECEEHGGSFPLRVIVDPHDWTQTLDCVPVEFDEVAPVNAAARALIRKVRS